MERFIRIRGAAQHALKRLDLDLPLGKIIALLGPSGSGKSTLAFDTLFAESRRRFLDCLSPRARQLLARPEKPLVDSIDGLPPALCLEQNEAQGSGRTLLGSLTETLDYLRILYAAIGVPHDPATGAPLQKMSPGEIVDELLKYPEQTRLTLLAPLPPSFGETPESDLLELRKQGFLRVRAGGEVLDLDELPPKALQNGPVELVVDRIVVREQSASRLADSLQTALRACPDEVRALVQEPNGLPTLRSFFTRYRNSETGFVLPDLTPKSFSADSRQGACPVCNGLGVVRKTPKSPETLCPACKGLRLSPTILAVTLAFGADEYNLAEFCRLSIRQNLALLPTLSVPEVLREPVAVATGELTKRLECLRELGLDYLSLDRPAATLSGGELQRARLAGQLGGGLSGVLYILDEPTIGLHPRETERLASALCELRDRGNTILIVEHDPQLLAHADWLVEMGPGSGPEGGHILAEGTLDELIANPRSPSGAWLSGAKTLPEAPAPAREEIAPWITLSDANVHNLKNVDFSFPLGELTCLSGPGGSGKSTLVHDCLLPAFRAGKLENGQLLHRVVVVDQSPLGTSPRSTPATATGLLDVLRPLYASLPLSKQRGYTASRFSTNVRGGRCERCAGTGVLEVDMNFLADVYTECDACRGQRYNRETLEVTWRGKSIAAALAQTVDEAYEFFKSIPAARGILKSLHDLGLGYLQLDRVSTTLSGGEAQRIKLAAHLAKASPRSGRKLGRGERLLFVLDEPSTGLHFGEVDLLLKALYALRAAGHTIICIEHHAGMLERADWLVEMGPGSGDEGGRIIYAGPPRRIPKPAPETKAPVPDAGNEGFS